MPWFECTNCQHRFYFDDDVEGDNCEQCNGGFLVGIEDEDVEETEDDE